MFASEASNPRSGLDIDAEHGSGTADPEGVELRCVNPVALRGGGRGSRGAFSKRSVARTRRVRSPRPGAPTDPAEMSTRRVVGGR